MTLMPEPERPLEREAGPERPLEREAEPERPLEREAEPTVIVFNRGPLSYRRDEHGGLVAHRGAGGVVSGLAPLVVNTATTWIAAAISDDDRAAAVDGLIEAEGFRVRSLVIDKDDYRAAYDVISNGTLWFAYHGLFDLSREPVIDQRWRAAWKSYRRVNAAFADAVAVEAPDGAVVLIQDFHLSLVAHTLVDRRPDLRFVHFSHTPFCEPSGLTVLPVDIRRELLEGLSSHRACGFHTARWAEAFQDCCRAEGIAPPRTFVAPLAPDPDDIAAVAGSAACDRAFTAIDRSLGGRRFVVRVDRIELSKNLLRGFTAFDDLLERYPEWRGNVVFGAHVYPSREGLAEYRRYRHDVEAKVAAINQWWGTPDWTPIVLDPSDDFPTSVAALRRYDALLVNPVRDGLNLVAMEGVLANERQGMLVLSTEAGGWNLLGDDALGVNPYDITATADALHRALSAPAEERAAHHKALLARVSSRTPADWLRAQVEAAGAA